MAWTQADIDALKAQMGLGVSEITYGDKTTKFQPLPDQVALLNLMEASVNGVGTIAQRTKQGIFFSTTNRNRYGRR